MLHKNPKLIAAATFALLQQLQSLQQLQNFYLVGGTALTLQLGHRNSIDLDLFSINNFDDVQLLDFLKSKYEVDVVYQKSNTIICIINKVKVDFIKYNYPLVSC